MAKGLTKSSASRFQLSRSIRIAIVAISIFALCIIFAFVVTAQSSNRLMSLDKRPLPNIPSNILPSYSPTNFRSLDGQTNLSGWFFRIDQPISTIILVHDTGKNRMQFDVETVDLVEEFLALGFNVFLFDMRNSGQSGGQVNGYGYSEWKDVIGAIDHVRRISVTTDVILYGVGSGCSAALLAYYHLPEHGETDEAYHAITRNLDFDKSYIAGIMLDSPAPDTDDYIRPLARQDGQLGILTQYSVPYAIRISSGEPDSLNLSMLIARMPIPLLILYGDQDQFIGTRRISHMVAERERLHPSTTISHVFSGADYTKAFEEDPLTYYQVIGQYVQTYFNKGV